jgi:hypothetical protein
LSGIAGWMLPDKIISVMVPLFLPISLNHFIFHLLIEIGMYAKNGYLVLYIIAGFQLDIP